jgi:putative ABC transport system permease protein
MSPIFRFLLRKMGNNRWLTFNLWLGLAVAVALTASVPIYKDAAVNRIIDKTLEERNAGGGASPGAMLIRYQAAAREYTAPEALLAVDAFLRDELSDRIGYPLRVGVRTWSLRSQTLAPADEALRASDGRRRQMNVAARSGLSEEIRLTAGTGWAEEGAGKGAGTGTGDVEGEGASETKAPSADASSTVLDALVWEEALARNDMEIGESYRYPVQTRSGPTTVTVRIVGAFQPKAEDAPYWQDGKEALLNVLFVTEEALLGLLEREGANAAEASWAFDFDLASLTAADVARLQRESARIDPELFRLLPQTKTALGFGGLLADFRRQSVRLEASLFVLAAPMLAIALYFIATGARQSLQRQRTDIAVLRSRGGSAPQLTRLFLYESLLLGAPAYAAGMAAAWGLAKAIGSTEGFLRFVTGKELELAFTPAAFGYGAVAVLASVAAATVPAWRYARTSIVRARQEQARADRPPPWQRLYLDAVALAVAAYGWYALRAQSGWLASAGGGGDEGTQPFLFFVPAFAIFAAGLCFLRLFPWLLRLVHAATGRWLPLPLHLSLLTLSRSAVAAYPLMLLLMLTLGLGTYHASAARTIDANASRALVYASGADVVLQPSWEGYLDEYDENGEYREESETRNVIYTEPPFDGIREMPGVRAAAKVLTEEGDLAVAGKPVGKGTLMGIQNKDFALAASFERSIYPVHPYQYLRLLGAYEQAALVSQKFAEAHGLKPGDSLTMTIRQTAVSFVIVGVVPYWPSLDPEASPFVVANLDYVYDQTPLVPYAVWLRMEPGAKVAPLLEAMREKGLGVASVRDVRSELALMRLDASKEGTFGLLSLGFLISVLLSFIGYLLYWVFALSQRTVQFGVLRASGLSRRQLTVMLLAEQLLTTGLAIGVGLGLGRLAGLAFLPLLQGAGRQVPPFAVVTDAADGLRLLVVTGAMVGIGAVALAGHIRKLRVHQAVKMGEER